MASMISGAIFWETDNMVINALDEFEALQEELANYNSTIFGDKKKVWDFSKKRTYKLPHYRRPILSITANHYTDIKDDRVHFYFNLAFRAVRR